MRNQIEHFDQACDALMELLAAHNLADGISGHLTGLTCDVHLYGDQVARLHGIVQAGIDATHAAHPSNGWTFDQEVYSTPGTSNGAA